MLGLDKSGSVWISVEWSRRLYCAASGRFQNGMLTMVGLVMDGTVEKVPL